MFILFFIVLLFSFPSFLQVWFSPNKYLNHVINLQNKAQKKSQFIPQKVIQLMYFNNKPIVSIWYGRILNKILIIICAIGILFSFYPANR